MSTPKTTRVIVNANPPVGAIKPDTFAIEERPLPELNDGEVLVKTLAFGNEPAQRGWIDGAIDPVSVLRWDAR
jgi:NADPH-dependent curcumin reductase CurA